MHTMATSSSFWTHASNVLLLSAAVQQIQGHLIRYDPKYGHQLQTPNEAAVLKTAALSARDVNPADFGWISKFAAIGDSFTAGIGSGEQLGDWLTSDWLCSRYTYAWPEIVNQALGPSVTTFDFKACSGDRTGGIYDQANALANGPYDVVMMTAGGNDLCLASMIKNCVFLPWFGQDECTSVISQAQHNIDTILKGNIKDILVALNDKVSDKGILVYNGYAPYFNTDNGDCADLSKEYWAIKAWWTWRYWFSTPLKLTQDLRSQFNGLVDNINKAISEVVDEVTSSGDVKYTVIYSDWSGWPGAVDGQYCSPNSQGYYPDDGQPNLMFYKRDTHVYKTYHDDLRRRNVNGTEHPLWYGEDPPAFEDLPEEEQQMIREAMKPWIGDQQGDMKDWYSSALYNSPDPRAVARYRLESRDAPAEANCPGDGGFDPTLGLGGPDSFLRNFHPNEQGHEAIAGFALENLIYARAKQLGVKDDICEPVSIFTCFSAKGSKAYTAWDPLNKVYESFCSDAKGPDNTINWSFSKTYYEGTPSEVDFTVQLSGGASSFEQDECVSSMSKIINGCDANNPDDPMNFKFGGSYEIGSVTYSVSPKKDRPMPVQTKTTGDCQGWYKVFFGQYTMHGSGWADWDWGQQTLLPSIKSCIGSNPTKWKFGYYDDPGANNGWEWWATFNTPIWVRARCFDNLNVQKAAGGYTSRYNKNFSDEQYSDAGCSGND